MAKKFNVTGTCIPSRHYMADTSHKLKQVLALVEQGEYFIINRPRQYGKTTTLFLLLKKLKQTPQYLPISISFEAFHNEEFVDIESFSKAFFSLLQKQLRLEGETGLADYLLAEGKNIQTFDGLSEAISTLVVKAGKKIVLMIDEVDKSSNNLLFISFLGLLRKKYLAALEERDFTFHSVVLAGLHDIKTLKLRIRPDEEQKYNSPWNIAADFDVEMSLLPHEIVPMLEDYSQEQGVQLDAPAIAERLYYYTSGYPFLVSALCKIFDEKMLPQKSERTWTVEDVETAAERLIKSERSNTNFDTLIKNLENDETLYDLVFRLVIENERLIFNIHDPHIYKGVLHGIFRNGDGLNIHNRIYKEVIVNYMASKLATEGKSLDIEIADPYLLPGNALDMEKLLLKFQELLREQYSKKDRDFLERNGRLIFLAFLKPIINGKGYAFKEPEISEEQRLDVAVTFYQHRYVVELKLWRGDAAHERGLAQLSGYLDRQHLDMGYLLIFDHSAKKTWKHEWLEAGNKRVFAVWV